MSGLAAVLRQVRYTNRSFWRNPPAAFFTVAFPLVFLVLFTVLFGSGSVQVGGVEMATSAFYVPGIATFSVITACYTNLAMSVTFARDQGVLKRIRGSPMPAWSYLTGRVVHAVLIGLLLVAVCVAFGVVVYDVRLSTSILPVLVVTLAAGAASFAALGLAVVAAVPNADAAPAVVNASILPLLFVSNVFIPLDNPPGWLNLVSNLFPVRHFADAMLSAFVAPAGAGFPGVQLAITGLWGLAGLLLAVRFFTWQPRV